jgi:hypothetical protein
LPPVAALPWPGVAALDGQHAGGAGAGDHQDKRHDPQAGIEAGRLAHLVGGRANR